MKDERITVGAGREIAYIDIGEPEWPCVMFFHGSPSSRMRLAYLEQRFLDKRIRVVSPDRPGYGQSSPQPGRTIMDWPADVANLANRLELEQFTVAGHSSGGPYALACAVRLPERVGSAIILGGVTDMGWQGAWDGYLESEAQLMRMPDEEAVRVWCVERFGPDGSGFMAASGFEFPDPDKQLYADEKVAQMLAAARAEAFRQGVGGYAQDIFIQGRPWPFDPNNIVLPVHVLHGESDTLLPVAHSRHTAERIPGSHLEVLPEHGHFTILGELPRIVSSLKRSLT